MGPLYTKGISDYDSVEEDDMYKCYVTLYTCASTRGIILDLVPVVSRLFIYAKLKCLVNFIQILYSKYIFQYTFLSADVKMK